MTSETTRVIIHIMDSEYRVSCPEGEEEKLVEAARYLNEKMQEIRDSGKVIGVDRIGVMVALNISYELLKCKQDSAEAGQWINDHLRRLLSKIETAFDKSDSE